MSRKYKVTYRAIGDRLDTINCDTADWASHRREYGFKSPRGIPEMIAWVNIIEAVNLQNGEVLNRMAMWREVLSHRDDGVPWYVEWADEHPMVDALIQFTRDHMGQFRATHRPMVLQALESIKLRRVDNAILTIMATETTTLGLRKLSQMERAACRVAGTRICAMHKIDPNPELLARFPI